MSEGDSSNVLKPMTEEQIKKSAVGLTEKQLTGPRCCKTKIPRGSKKVMAAMLKMGKVDINTLKHSPREMIIPWNTDEFVT